MAATRGGWGQLKQRELEKYKFCFADKTLTSDMWRMVCFVDWVWKGWSQRTRTPTVCRCRAIGSLYEPWEGDSSTKKGEGRWCEGCRCWICKTNWTCTPPSQLIEGVLAFAKVLCFNFTCIFDIFVFIICFYDIYIYIHNIFICIWTYLLISADNTTNCHETVAEEILCSWDD